MMKYDVFMTSYNTTTWRACCYQNLFTYKNSKFIDKTQCQIIFSLLHNVVLIYRPIGRTYFFVISLELICRNTNFSHDGCLLNIRTLTRIHIITINIIVFYKEILPYSFWELMTDCRVLFYNLVCPIIWYWWI